MSEIFISFKKTDDNDDITRDSLIASELYSRLISMGYDVFFSSKTLEEMGVSRYKDVNFPWRVPLKLKEERT